MKLKIPMKITQKTKIRHRNELNHTLAQLPLAAKRVLYMALAPIDSKKPIEEGRVFRVRADELSAIAEISVSSAYQQLKEGARLLRSSSLSLTGDDIVALSDDLNLPYSAKNKPSEIDLSITDYCAYFNNAGYLELRFSRIIEPYISSLIGKNNRFTTQLLASSVKLSGQYSSAIYQLIRKNYSTFKGKNTFVIKLNDLKDEIMAYTFLDEGGVEYKYPEFPIFKRDVLTRSISEIKKKTEVKSLSFSTYEKEGRKVSSLRFEFFIDEDSFTGEGSNDEPLDSEFIKILERDLRVFPLLK